MKKITVNGESQELVAEKVLPVIIYGEEYNTEMDYEGEESALEVFNGFLDGRPVYFCFTSTDSDGNSETHYLPLLTSVVKISEASSDDSSSEVIEGKVKTVIFRFYDYVTDYNYTVNLNLGAV